MPDITIEKCLYRFGGHAIPLISGEFHYWRVLRENWPAVIGRIREMGLDVVSTYIPWNYHELEPERYDFTGETSPQRDLAGFIDLLAERGLWLIARPGPYIYSEWQHGGVPERVTKFHRLAPEFLAMSRHYILGVCDVLAPRQITRGGNIILCQADNEPYPPIESFGTEIGGFGEPGVFKDWLAGRYGGDVAKLNAVWRTDLASFDDACIHFHEAYVDVTRPMAARLLPTEEHHGRYADTHAFIGWYAAEIVRTCSEWLRDGGIDVPVYANGWSPLYQDFSEFMRVAGLAGTDIYPPSFFEGRAPAADNWFYNIDIVKLQEADVANGNVWSAEYQCGVYPIQTVGYLPPQHFKHVGLALMARGLKGWNWYMLVNRDNWYHCPINEWGRTNEYFPVHAEIVATAKRVEPWHTAELNDVSLLCYKPHRVIAPGNFEAAFRVLEEADVAFDYYDPQSDNPPRTNVVVYAGADWIDRASAAKLREWAEAGGTLLYFNRFPVRDECGRPLDALPFRTPDGARPVNLPVTVTYRGGAAVIKDAGHMGWKVNFCYYRTGGGEPIRVVLSTAAKEQLVDIGAAEAESFVIGCAAPLGDGKVVHVGSNPSAALVKLVLDQERLRPHVACDHPRVLTTIHRHTDGHLVLFAISRSDEKLNAEVSLNAGRLGVGASEVRDLVADEDVPADRIIAPGRLLVPLAPRDVAVWQIA